MLSTLVLAVGLGWAAQVIELRPLGLLRDLGNMGVFLQGYLHPSFAHLSLYAWQCVITVCIALWGTVLAIAIAVPLGLLGAQNLAPHPLLYLVARRVMDLFRAVNEFVLALMFVTAVGLGPFAGMLALGMHTGGVLGKLLSECIEAIDPGQVEGVTAVGAPHLHIIGFGVVPQVLPNFLSYILLRFESDIRLASVIGMVGGGGIGFYLCGTRSGPSTIVRRPQSFCSSSRWSSVLISSPPVFVGPSSDQEVSMCRVRSLILLFSMLLSVANFAFAADPTWPKELTFALLSTESAPEVGRRWTPVLEQLSQDLGVPVKQVAATDYRGSIKALRFNKAQIGQLGPKGYVEASNDNYANVEPIVQLQHANGSLGYRSCLMVHAESDLFSPEDIAGKTFAFNDPNSTSGYLVSMAFFLMEMGVNPKEHFAKLTFSGSHEASILAVANKKVEVASTNLPDLQQMTREDKIPPGTVWVIWVSNLIPNDPIVVRKDLPESLKQAIQQALTTMRARTPQALLAGGAWIGGFAKVDDTTYQIIRDLNETTKRLAALK